MDNRVPFKVDKQNQTRFTASFLNLNLDHIKFNSFPRER